MSNLLLRVFTALVGVPLIVGLVYAGGWPFLIVVALAALAAQYEFYGLAELGGLRPQKWLGLLLGLAVILHGEFVWSNVAILVGLLLLVALVPFRSDEKPLASAGAVLLGVVYPTAFMASLVRLRTPAPEVADERAFALTLSVIVLVWATDTFAYAVGRFIGRRPLAPRISPKKTWEGAVGGAIGAMAVAALLRLTILDFVAWHHVLVVALLCGVLGQIGDLAESRMKRTVGAKDSGRLLPGHGGVLDRIDALILAAPLVYAYLAIAGVVR